MSVSNRYAQIGAVQADARRQRGSTLGDLVVGLSQVPAQIFARRDQEQAAQQQAARQQRRDEREDVDINLRIQEFEQRRQQAAQTYAATQDKAERERQAVDVLEAALAADPSMSEQEKAAARAAVRVNPDAVVAHLLKAKPPPPALIQHDPTRDLVNPQTGAVVTEGVPAVEKPKPTGQPFKAMVNGREQFVQQWSDGTTKPLTGMAPVPERPPAGPQPGWQWVTRQKPDGTNEEVYTNRVNPGDRPQTARVKATEDERKTAGFYGQMSDAIKVIDELEGGLTEKELYQIQTLPQEALIGMANRNTLSEGAKRYLRAFEQFTESRLRPVSGAAIADTEYERDRRTYARQYAETPKLAADRARARTLALDALKKRAGVALDDANTDAAAPPKKRTSPF